MENEKKQVEIVLKTFKKSTYNGIERDFIIELPEEFEEESRSFETLYRREAFLNDIKQKYKEDYDIKVIRKD